MSVNNELYGVVGLGVNLDNEADSAVANYMAAMAPIKVETGIVELFRPDQSLDHEKRNTNASRSVSVESVAAQGVLVEDSAPAPVAENPIISLRKYDIQQQILNNAAEIADELDIDDDIDVADSFEASFADLSGFAAAEGFFDNNIDDRFDFGEDERASIGYGEDLTGVSSLVIDNFTNASNPFIMLQGVERLGFITEDLKAIQNRALMGVQ